MRPITLDLDPANTDADGFADGNSSAGATLTLDGALTSGGTFTSADGLAHRVVILDLGADNQTGATYTFTGTDADGRSQTEAIAGPGASASVTTTKYFLTVTSVAIASPVAGSTVDVGTVDEFASPTIPLDYTKSLPPLVSFDVTGTITLKLHLTNDDPRIFGDTTAQVAAAHQISDQNGALWFTHSTITGDEFGSITDWPVKALRVVSDSYTNTAEVQVEVTSIER